MRPGFAGVANIAAASGMLECVKLVRFITNRDKAAELHRKLRLTQSCGDIYIASPARPFIFGSEVLRSRRSWMISNGATVKPQLQTEATRVQVIIDLRGTLKVCPEFNNMTRVLRYFAELQGCVSTEYFSRATKFDFRARSDAKHCDRA